MRTTLSAKYTLSENVVYVYCSDVLNMICNFDTSVRKNLHIPSSQNTHTHTCLQCGTEHSVHVLSFSWNIKLVRNVKFQPTSVFSSLPSSHSLSRSIFCYLYLCVCLLKFYSIFCELNCYHEHELQNC